MIMAFESSGQEITADSVKNKLLQEIKWSDQAEKSFNAPSYYTVNRDRKSFSGNYRGNNYRGNFNNRSNGRGRRYNNNNNFQSRRCYRCLKIGHIERECRQANYCNDDDENSSICENFRNVSDETVSFAHLSLISVDNNDNNDTWVIDSAASRHMSNIENKFKNLKNSNTKYITVTNKNKTSVIGEGLVIIDTVCNNVKRKLDLQNTLCLPNLSTNLLSVSCSDKDGYEVTFKNGKCYIINKDRKTIATGSLMPNGIYLLNINDKNNVFLANTNINTNNVKLNLNYSTPAAVALMTHDTEIWHHRLGHLYFQYRKYSETNQLASISKINNSSHVKPVLMVNKLSSLIKDAAAAELVKKAS